MMFHAVVLALHNIFRWIVLVMAIVALVIAYRGWFGRREYTERDRTFNVVFTSMLDLQFLLGIVLVLLAGIGNLGSFLIEHVIPMVVAIVLAHFGSVRARRLEIGWEKHRQTAIWYTLAVLVILLAIPWPPRRPLLPRI